MHNTQQPVVIQTANRKLTGPFTVIHTGSPASTNALALAINLAVHEESALSVWFTGAFEADAETAILTGIPFEVKVHHVSEQPALAAELSQIVLGTVLLPVELAPLFESIRVTTIVVP
jgi:hypothetical protein